MKCHRDAEVARAALTGVVSGGKVETLCKVSGELGTIIEVVRVSATVDTRPFTSQRGRDGCHPAPATLGYLWLTTKSATADSDTDMIADTFLSTLFRLCLGSADFHSLFHLLSLVVLKTCLIVHRLTRVHQVGAKNLVCQM